MAAWQSGVDYLNGKKVLTIAAEFEVARAAVNQWLRWYDAAGTEATFTPASPPVLRSG